MKIKKTFQGSIPENKILNAHSTSQTDTYSCEKINEMTKKVITTGAEFATDEYIDGERVYRLRKNFGGIDGTIDIKIPFPELENVKTVIRTYGHLVGREGDIKGIVMPLSCSGSNQMYQVRLENKVIYYSVDANRKNWDFIVDIEYTKKTD